MSKAISDMPVLTALEGADSFTVLDASELDPTLKNKQITKTNALAGMTADPPGAGNKLRNQGAWVDAGGAATLNVGTTAGTVAAGDAPASQVAGHEGVYAHGNLPTAAQKAALNAAATLSGADPVVARSVLDTALAGLGIVTDHGGLTGLADDDHPQYLNTARGDARYSQTGHNHSGVYEPVLTAASQAEMEAGTEAALRSMSPLRVAQAIASLGGGGGGATLPADYLYGAVVSVTGNQSISVAPGTVVTESGATLSWTSPITVTGITLSANTWAFVYAYNNAGTPAIEVSTTAPVSAPYWGRGRSKTGDTGRRLIEVLRTTGVADTLMRNTRHGSILFAPYNSHSPVSNGVDGAYTQFTAFPFLCAWGFIWAPSSTDSLAMLSLDGSTIHELVGQVGRIPWLLPTDSAGKMYYKRASGTAAITLTTRYWMWQP